MLVKCAQQQTKLTASELVSRPTYLEEFENIRDNYVKAIKAKTWEDEEWDNISHYSRVSQKHPHA